MNSALARKDIYTMWEKNCELYEVQLERSALLLLFSFIPLEEENESR